MRDLVLLRLTVLLYTFTILLIHGRLDTNVALFECMQIISSTMHLRFYRVRVPGIFENFLSAQTGIPEQEVLSARDSPIMTEPLVSVTCRNCDREGVRALRFDPAGEWMGDIFEDPFGKLC